MPRDQFPNKPIKKEKHERDIDWTIEQLKISIPNLDKQTSTEVIVETLKTIISDKPEEFYSNLEVIVREKI